VLMSLTERDLGYIDAHAHLGNLEFEGNPATALRHYEIGRRIGELSFPEEFKGLLPWALPNNRPYLRCLHGYGLALWRLKKLDEAKDTFERMLWLNPNDNQGARYLHQAIRCGKRWEECADGRIGRSRLMSKPASGRSDSRKHAVVDVGPQDRAVTLAEQMQQADDLNRKYNVNDLLEVLNPAAMTRKALANFWEWKKVEEVSLRELMDMAIVEETDPKPGYLVTQLLDLRCVGIKGFWSVVNRLTALDLGARCNAEWSRRRIKLKGCWRVYGVRHGWSKPLAPDVNG